MFVDLALDPGLDLLQNEAVGLEHVGKLTGVLPPAIDDLRLDSMAIVDQPLNRLSDLIFAAPGGLQGASGFEDRGAEEVDADQSEVGGRISGLLDQTDDPVAVQLGDPIGLGIVNRREQDQRVGYVLAKGRDEAAQAVAEQVVAEIHDERRIAEKSLRGQHRVGEAGGLVLDDVGDLRPEGRAVAGGLSNLVTGLRGDDDPDLGRRPASTRASIP